MKKIILLLSVVAISFPALAQKTKKQVKPKAESMAPQPGKESLKEHLEIQEQRQVGPMHQLLIQWNGHWIEQMKVWTEGNNDPKVIVLHRESMIVCEGRFLESKIRGEMYHMPYEANSVIGYDNAKMVFVKTWYDNLGTSILVLEGTYDPKTSSIDFRGNTTDFKTKMPVMIHQKLTFSDPTKQLLEVFVIDKAGKETKTMEIISNRG